MKIYNFVKDFIFCLLKIPLTKDKKKFLRPTDLPGFFKLVRLNKQLFILAIVNLCFQTTSLSCSSHRNVKFGLRAPCIVRNWRMSLLDQSLMIGWRKSSWVHTATEHTFWPRNIIFGLNDPWDMRKKQVFFFLRNFHCYAFFLHFSIFFLI